MFERGISLADVFVPKLGMSGDERIHQIDATLIAKDNEIGTTAFHVGFGPLKRDVLAHDDPWDFVKQSRPAAHVTRRQG